MCALLGVQVNLAALRACVAVLVCPNMEDAQREQLTDLTPLMLKVRFEDYAIWRYRLVSACLSFTPQHVADFRIRPDRPNVISPLPFLCI